MLHTYFWVVLGFLFFLVALAVRHHLNGSRQVWYCPVPMYGWFTATSKQSKLPQPATAPTRSRSRSRPGPQPYQGPARQDSGRSGRSSEKKYVTPSSSFRSQRTIGLPEMAYAPHRSAPRVPNAPLYDKYRRDASPRREGPRDKYRRDASPRR
jgi:hypothetical protein